METWKMIAYYIFCFAPAMLVGGAIGLWLFMAIMDFNSLIGRGIMFMNRGRKSR